MSGARGKKYVEVLSISVILGLLKSSEIRGTSRQWRIQDFPEEGALTLKGGPTYYLANFFRKLHGNEEISGQRGGRPLDPPSARDS